MKKKSKVKIVTDAEYLQIEKDLGYKVRYVQVILKGTKCPIDGIEHREGVKRIIILAASNVEDFFNEY